MSEQPLFTLGGIFTSNLRKLVHYGQVFAGRAPPGAGRAWRGSENWLRLGMRLMTAALPIVCGGLNDHLPSDVRVVVCLGKLLFSPKKIVSLSQTNAR